MKMRCHPVGLALSALLLSACTAPDPGPVTAEEQKLSQLREGADMPAPTDRTNPNAPSATPVTKADRLAERGPVGTVVERPGGPVNQPVPGIDAGLLADGWPSLTIEDIAGRWQVSAQPGTIDCTLTLGPASESQPGTVTATGNCPFGPDGLQWVYFAKIGQLALLSGPGKAVWRGQRRGAMEFHAMKDGELLIMTRATQ